MIIERADHHERNKKTKTVSAYSLIWRLSSRGVLFFGGIESCKIQQVTTH